MQYVAGNLPKTIFRVHFVTRELNMRYDIISNLFVGNYVRIKYREPRLLAKYIPRAVGLI